MGYLFFDTDILTFFFHFGLYNQPICNILTPNPKSELGGSFRMPYLNWRYNFNRFSRNFCQNAWTLRLYARSKIMLFGSAQWDCEMKDKCRSITSIREYLPYWKFRLADFPLGIHSTCNFMWIISFQTFQFQYRVYGATFFFFITALSSKTFCLSGFLGNPSQNLYRCRFFFKKVG